MSDRAFKRKHGARWFIGTTPIPEMLQNISIPKFCFGDARPTHGLKFAIHTCQPELHDRGTYDVAQN
jgi:hypothetical protein